MASFERICLASGIVAAVLFVSHTATLGALLPGYSPIHHTISEIGEHGSPFEAAFRIAQLGVALCLALFAFGFWRHGAFANLSIAPAILIVICSVTLAGTAVFEAPHPLHNVFGITMMIGYLAPLALTLGWDEGPETHLLRLVSAIVAAILLIGIAINFSPLFVDYQPGDFVRENYGALQRLVHFPFYLWCAFLAAALLEADGTVRHTPTLP